MRSSTRSWPSLARLLAVGLLVVALGAACTAAATPSPTATSSPAAATPVISDAWVRPPMGADRPAAGYLVIANPGDQADALIAATSQAAMGVEIHETTMGSSGMTGMQPVSRIDIPAGSSVELKPGGYHLMLMHPKPMTAGQTVELELTFEKAGKVTIKAEVRNG